MRISCALKLDKNLPPIPVDLIAQQVEWQTSIPKVPAQIPLEFNFFSCLWQCRLIVKFLFHNTPRMILKYITDHSKSHSISILSLHYSNIMQYQVFYYCTCKIKDKIECTYLALTGLRYISSFYKTFISVFYQ